MSCCGFSLASRDRPSESATDIFKYKHKNAKSQTSKQARMELGAFRDRQIQWSRRTLLILRRWQGGASVTLPSPLPHHPLTSLPFNPPLPPHPLPPTPSPASSSSPYPCRRATRSCIVTDDTSCPVSLASGGTVAVGLSCAAAGGLLRVPIAGVLIQPSGQLVVTFINVIFSLVM